jgi:hypothetical protein
MGGQDNFVAKFSITGALQWGTYYGGSALENSINAISVDNSGNVYITGLTQSPSGIATPGAYQTVYSGYGDVYLAKFNTSGTMQWSTYYGGSAFDAGYGVATDAAGNVYITGETASTSGIATSGAYQSTTAGSGDAFIAKFTSAGAIQWATYYGGSSGDRSSAISVDGAGNTYIVGYTGSSSSIATLGAYQTAIAGANDVFLAKFNGSGAIQWASYYGGAAEDEGNSITTDISGNIYITGLTASTSGIATLGAYQTVFGGVNDVFLAKFNTSGAIQWSTYYGGSDDDEGYSVAFDGAGNLYMTGLTQSTSGIATSGAYQVTTGGDGDAFLTKFNTSGAIQWASYYGGSGYDYGNGVTTDNFGDVYITGYTTSTSGIATLGGYQTTLVGGNNALLAQFNFVAPITGTLNVCVGSNTTLSDATAGGVWSSGSNAIGTVGSSTGIVTGISAGTTTISYTVSGNTVTTVVTVSTFPIVGTITGTANVCHTFTAILSDAATGGVWSSVSGGVASVGSTGIVTGISGGTSVISYTVTNGCGTVAATSIATVDPAPDAGTISGSAVVCTGATTTLTDVATGGTWSSVSGGVASVGSTGIVSGITVGTSIISYLVINSCGTIAATTTVTVNPLAVAGSITGTSSSICPGSTTTLADPATGGVWSSVTTSVATVGTTGTVTAGSIGTSLISYTVTNSCGTAAATYTVTVSATPYPGVITAPLSICQFSSGTATETVPGGTWSTATGNVTISSAGAIYGASLGPDYIIYTVTSSCGTAADSFAITVNPLPDAGSISSTSSEICISGTALFTDGATGGSWSSATPAYATISGGGLLTGRSAGVAVISYTVSNGCGIAAATATILVDGAPDAGFISGVPGICISGVAVFSDGAAGGSWSSTVPTVAAIDAYGDVSPASVGSTTISYTVTNACGSIAATYPVTIVGYPTGGTILGTPTVCVTSAVTLSDASAGGVWSISGGTATIGSSSGIVTGTTSGLALVTYTVTNLCGTASAPYTVSVDPLPHAGVVTGLDSVCRGSLLSLADTTAGGAWTTAGSGIATVSSSGTVVGLASGTETIIYTTTNMCGTATATKRILVNDVPVVPGISGATSVCAGAHITLTDGTTGGTWHSTGSAATAAGGVITGVTADTVTITYSVTNSCGTTAVATIVTVNIAPASNPILGPATYCIDELSHLYDSTSGGIWSISNGNAYLDATGSIAALTPGQDTVTYVATNACGTASETFVVTIYPDSICYPVSVQTTTANETALSVFPNPNNGSFSMQLTSPTSGSVHFVITNILGEKIKETDSDTNTPAAVTLNVAGGIYFVSAITADGSRYMQKVIVR